MAFPPFPSFSITLRVLLKAIIILVVVNLICAATNFNPVRYLTRINSWGLVGHGRERLIYQNDLKNGILPIDSLMAAHAIAYTPKANDEFRVLILGNSGPYGAGLSDDETISAQLSQRNIRINGKKIVAYNLAFPSGDVVSSTIILDAALAYQPDLIISFVTANMFNNRASFWDQESVFMLLNREALEKIARQYDMSEWLTPRLSPHPVGYELIGIHDSGTLIPWLSSLFYPFTQPQIEHPNWRIAQDQVPAEPNNFDTVPGTYPVLNPTWNFLDISQQMANKVGARLLVVNQPTVVVEGPHADVSYSRLYGRAFYDTYIATIQSYTQTHHLTYADMWQLIPANYYTDSELHFDTIGVKLVVDELARLIPSVN